MQADFILLTDHAASMPEMLLLPGSEVDPVGVTDNVLLEAGEKLHLRILPMADNTGLLLMGWKNPRSVGMSLQSVLPNAMLWKFLAI